jgi:TolB-like protein
VPWLKENRQPLLTGTFVNINSLEDSSALGRIVADQISSRFAQQGFTMVELRLRRNVFIKTNAGEFMLSREVRNLSRLHNAAAVIAGTYAVGRNNVYVSARLIRAADNLIIASYDYALPLGPDTKALLVSQ